jgi:hypothetical protein
LKFKCVVAGVPEKFLPNYLTPLIDTDPRKRFHIGESGGWSIEITAWNVWDGTETC